MQKTLKEGVGRTQGLPHEHCRAKLIQPIVEYTSKHAGSDEGCCFL